jgi:1-acyl-sn-glycerol-3-phosphate acyltransferase
MSKRKSGGGKAAKPRTAPAPTSASSQGSPEGLPPSGTDPRAEAASAAGSHADAQASTGGQQAGSGPAPSADVKPASRAASRAKSAASAKPATPGATIDPIAAPPLGKPIRIADLKVPPLPQLDLKPGGALPSEPPAPSKSARARAARPATPSRATAPAAPPTPAAPPALEPPSEASRSTAPIEPPAPVAASAPPVASAGGEARADASADELEPPASQTVASPSQRERLGAPPASAVSLGTTAQNGAANGVHHANGASSDSALRQLAERARAEPEGDVHEAASLEGAVMGASDEEIWSDGDAPSGNQISPVPAFAVEGPLSEALRDEPAARLTRSSSGDRAREAADFGTSQSLLSTDYYFRQYGAHGLRSMAAEVDDFGFDPHVDGKMRPALELLCKRYFRVALAGIEHVPTHGRALLVANRSGALPWDGLVLRTALRMNRPELPPLRWLAEDSVIHYPFMGVFMNRLGAVRACPENAERLLAQDRLVAVFPEGAQGSRKLFRDRYRLQRFGRGGYVKLALKFGVPILPTAIVGAEETNPVLGRSRLLGRFVGSDSVPLTPTFPWLGLAGLLPAPVRWRIVVGAPIDLSSYGPESADDALVVHRLNEQIRSSLQTLVDDGKQQRGSALFG